MHARIPSHGGHRTRLAGASLAATLLLAGGAVAQVPCGTAVSQLQYYVAQVNQAAVFEYYQGIPARCFGNAYCAQSQLFQLDAWYRQQSLLVNDWYGRITAACTAEGVAQRLPTRRDQSSNRRRMDETAIEDLEVDDEDRTVRIRIPDTADGYEPR